MRTTVGVAVGAAALGTVLFAAAPAANAEQICDPYTGVCTGGAANPVQGNTTGRGTAPVVIQNHETPANPTGTAGGGALPFTGGEFVLMSLVGAAAVAGGSILVASGRRRSPRTA
jgi:hypothetical protein